MNIDELKKEWAERDQQLEKSIRLNTQLLRESLVEKRNGAVRRSSLLGFLIELPFYVLTIVCLGKFIISHVSEMQFLMPALLLEVWSVVMLVALTQQLAAMYRLDLGEPVLALQKQLIAIRMARLRTVKWGLLSGLLVWCAPFFIVIAKGLLNVDLYSVSAFLVYNMAGAGVLAVLTLMVLSRYATSIPSARVTAFLDALAGRDIAKAGVFLKQLSSFERNETRA